MNRAEPLDRDRGAAECAELMATSDPWLTLGRSRENALAVLMDPAKEVHAIRDENGVAGFVVIDMRGLLRGYVQILCVRADCRGQGVGSELLRWAEERIFRDSPNVFMCVSSFNAGARRLYERLGFELVGTLRDLLVPGHDELLLRKTRGSWAAFKNKTQERTMQATTPSDSEIVLVQTFSAPREAVFAALTDAKQIAEYLKPTAFTLVSCEVDPRVGGKLRYVFGRSNGRRIEVRGTFETVEPPHRFAYGESYDFSPLEVQVTTSLEEVVKRTRLTQTLRYASKQERDEDYPGVTESAKEVFANLDRYLETRNR
jgi:uncharacterized protein YndB with AHSA1/START domain/ribosomal protein S18 acetylase RimI-like enzyme